MTVDLVSGPQFYEGILHVEKPCDTFLSFKGWVKGVAFINGFNLGRFWPVSVGSCPIPRVDVLCGKLHGIMIYSNSMMEVMIMEMVKSYLLCV